MDVHFYAWVQWEIKEGKVMVRKFKQQAVIKVCLLFYHLVIIFFLNLKYVNEIHLDITFFSFAFQQIICGLQCYGLEL